MNYKLFLILFLLSIISPAAAYQWNDFPVNNPIISGNTIIDHNNFVYSSTADGIYQIGYGTGRNTYFGFALSGTANSNNFVKFTSDYQWSKSVSPTGDSINVRATNNQNNWITDFSFTPYSTKITNTLTNTLPVAITNAKFYYIFSVNQGDTVLYNSLNYNIPSNPNIHLSGNLNNNLPSLKINNNMLFDYQDIIDNGFSITDFYLKPASSLGINYAGNVAAIGFTKNSGVILSGETITIDPLLNNGDFETGTGSWSFSGNGTWEVISPGYEGSNMARANLIGTGTADQLYQYGFSLEPNTSYRFSVVANSTIGNNIDFLVRRHSAPYTYYGLNQVNVNLTTSMQRFTYDFNTTGFSSTTTDTRLVLFMSNYATGTEKYYFDSISLEKTYYPPTPININSTNGTDWVNHTWDAGIGNITNSFNVSHNGTWTNGSSNTYFNVSVGIGNWSNISVYAYNSSGAGSLNLTPISQNVQTTGILNLINFTFSNIAQSEPQIYQSSQANRISVDVNDSDGYILNVSVGISYLGFEAVYPMTGGNDTWSYDFKSGVPGTYTVTNIYATDNASGTNSTTTGLSFVVVPLQQGGTGSSGGTYPTVTPTPAASVTPQPTSTQSPLIPLATPKPITPSSSDNIVPSFISSVSAGLSGLNNAIMNTFSQPSTTAQWLDSQIATVFRSDNFFAGSTVEDLLDTVTPGQFQILLVIAAFIGLMLWEDKGRKNKYN